MDIELQRARRIAAGLIDNYLHDGHAEGLEMDGVTALRELANDLLEQNVLEPASALADMVARARGACGCHGCVPSVKLSHWSNQFSPPETVARPSMCLAMVLLQSELGR